MKLIRNIFLVIIFAVAVAFCLYIAPNFKKTGFEDRTNLVINFKNVTGTMKGEVIREEGNVYISLDDINNYYDRYIYLDEKYNYIIASGNGHLACFDIKSGKAEFDNKTINAKIIKQNGLYYVPINLLKDIYNIDVEYKEKTDIVTIESLNSELKQATVNKKISVKSKATMLSRTIERIDENSVVYVKDAGENQSNNEASTDHKSIMGKVNKFITDQEKKIAENWIPIKTENGTIGYIPKDSIDEIKITRSAMINEKKTISLVWDYFENTIAIPKNNANTNYKGINVVSPAFLFVEDDGNIRENVGDTGLNYISWAKSKKYEIWPMVKCDNLLTDNMRNLLSDYKKRENLISQIVLACEKYNFNGVNIDMENINQKDKDYFSRFIIELKPRLESRGMKLSVDVTAPDGSPNWSLCYDRKTIGDVADYIIFMAYDQTSKKSSTIGSNASYDWVELNLKKFIKNNEVDPHKIILAIPFYSRLWKINSDGTSAGGFDININNQDKYLSKAVKKEWLNDALQNYVEYTNAGYTYKMWVEDEQSISKKLDLINEYDIAGAAFWEKGCEVESIWDIVEQKLF
ncbi:MAG: hypothetical protein IJH12_08390 [Clostridia bacterium]|nr:hypothetical protein [Clostridia bacterium]